MKPHKKKRAPEKPAPKPQRTTPAWVWPAVIVACVGLFYWVPLTSSSASIQWDAADMHYPLQKYFSDHLRSGSLPFWTPYLFAGYPFLANTEVAAWYPPHWPFYLAGITPGAIQAELAVNATIACLGAYVLVLSFVRHRGAAIFGALAYGLSGFFAGHSSHVGIFCAASWLPWLLAAYRRAMDSEWVGYAALGGLAGGFMILAGYPQTALYGLLALGLFAAGDFWQEGRRWTRALGVLAIIAIGTLALGGILLLPGLELTRESVRAGSDFSKSTEGVLHFEPLLTLIAPNWLGALTGNYRGPFDITQYYFYGGLLLVPMAALGVAKNRVRIPALAILVPAVWYMLGPAAGFYRLGVILPGLHSVRAPIQGWFVAALVLAMLAAAGAAWVFDRWRHPAVATAIVGVLFLDLWYWNLLNNPLTFGRAAWDQLYDAGGSAAARQIAATQPPLTRFDEPANGLPLGPLDHPLNLRLETTSGYFALEPRRTAAYRDAIPQNPRLRGGINASRFADIQRATMVAVPNVLPRAYFPKSITDVATEAASSGALGSLDPAAGSVVLGPHASIQQDPAAWAGVVGRDERSYRVQYRAASPSLLKLSESWFPGWHASRGATELPIVRVDHALMGVVVPAGTGEILFEYRPNYFRYGAGITLLAALILGGLATPAAQRWLRRHPIPAEEPDRTAPRADGG